MAWNSITENVIEDVKTDRKSAKGIEKYMISKKAIYFEGKYLPISQIRSVSIHDSTYYPHCCCGRGIPVKKLKIEYGAEKPLILMFESEKNANGFMQAVTVRLEPSFSSSEQSLR
ncbi:MAG: hypothetical protein K6E49_05010 [Lachnospiraceae bacterium]|nr:hypothetical protein [Lachnospiraceae bacterium]